jgi:ribosomal protein S18 acetylase RimI-like enzyme
VAQGHRRVVLDVSPDNARAAAFYRKLGFSFLPEWEPLASYPEITVQKMEWLATRA